MNTPSDTEAIQPKPGARRRGWLAWLGRGAIGLLVFLAILLVAGAVYESVASANDLKKYPPPGRLVDMGGYKLHLYCTGEHQAGRPTVILEAGSGSASPDWGLVQPDMAGVTRVCSYDRAGYMWSDPGSLPRTSQRFVEELRTLLDKAGEEGPYLLVGHSLGAHTVRLFAHQYPESVVGVILVDARLEDMAFAIPEKSGIELSFWAALARIGFFRLVGKTVLPPQILEKMPDYPWPIMFRPKFFETSRDEDAATSDEQVQAVGDLGDMPLIVIAAADNQYLDKEKALANLSSQGEFILAEGSGHFVHIDRPDIVMGAIRQLIASTPESPPQSTKW